MEEPNWFTDGACDILGGAERTGFIQSREEKRKLKGDYYSLQWN